MAPQGGNANTWLFTKQEYLDSPTIRQGASIEEDMKWRNKGIAFIMMCGKELGM